MYSQNLPYHYTKSIIYLLIVQVSILIQTLTKLDFKIVQTSVLLKINKEMEKFYLMTHSTHFILRLHGIRHTVKDHSDSEKGNPLLPHRLLFLINRRVILNAPSHRQDSTYHIICYTSRGALAGTRNRSMGMNH